VKLAIAHHVPVDDLGDDTDETVALLRTLVVTKQIGDLSVDNRIFGDDAED
jgi:hypothetical protein